MDQLKDSLRVFVVPTEILDAELDIYQKMVYMVLRSYANGQDDTAFPSYATIAKKGSMGRRKAIDCVKKLIELGLVSKEPRKKVSNDGKISDTSNLYTIYRPSEVVHDMHPPSAHDAPPLVHDMHPPSAHDAPELKNLKELDLKTSSSSSSSSITLDSVDNELKQKYPNVPFEEVKTELLNDETATINTDKQYKSLLEYRLKNWKPKQTKSSSRKGKATVRKEKLPEWFDKQPQPQQPSQLEVTKEELEDELREFRKQ